MRSSVSFGASSRRVGVAQTVNSELVALYWQVGRRLLDEVVGDERAATASRW